MRALSLAGLVSVSLVVAACGGTSIVDGEFGEGGDTGNGGNTNTVNSGGNTNTVNSGGNNTGGNTVNSGGNNTGGNNTGGNNTGGNNTGGNNTGGNGGNGGDPNCIGCNDFIMGGFNGNLCDKSADILAELFECVCGFGCPMECADSVCAASFPSDPCLNCLTSVCGAELGACLGD